MAAANTRMLFIPVSGARGMGEYARSLAIASAMTRRFPQLEVHFALSRAAPYAAAVPFAATLLPASPTFHTREVCALIREFRPRVVIFDNAGRTAQLRAARAAGARVVFVSSRPRQRHKAFRLRWLGLLDEHWIAYPEFIAGAVTTLERLKLRVARAATRVRFVDVLLPDPDATLSAATLSRFGLEAREFLLIVPGGGSGHPGAEDAPAVMAAAARALAARGCATLLAGGGVPHAGATAAAPDPPHLRRAPLLPLAELAELMRAARLVVSNGGDTLLQAIACGRPCVAVPIAHDQAHRIERCVAAGLALRGELEPRALTERVAALLAGTLPLPDPAAGRGPRVRNCLEEVLSALAALCR
jgi:ADP-heptose:LPS heptosyltransferase